MILVGGLFAFGLVFLAVEVFLPGGVLAILSGGCLLAGVVTAFLQLGPNGGALATGVALVIGIGTLYFEFVVLPKTRLIKQFSLTETVSGRSRPAVADGQAVIGAEVVAVTTLAPTGYVELEGRRYEALSQSGYASAGARLRIVTVDTFRLVVTQIKEPS